MSVRQLSLLADHLKLSLLERQRALALNLDSHKQDAQINRSLDEFQRGLDDLEKNSTKDDDSNVDNKDVARLRKQYLTLATQFGRDTTSSSSTTSENAASVSPSGDVTRTDTKILTTPNDDSLKEDFTRAQTLPSAAPSNRGRTKNQSLRFRDDPSAEQGRYSDRVDGTADANRDEDDEANRAALFSTAKSKSKSKSKSSSSTADESSDFQDSSRDVTSPRYRDDPDASLDSSQLSNQQIHLHHKQILSEQDSHLDLLSQSVSRQRMLGIEMGDELDMQNEMLGDLERGVDRHATTLERARRKLGEVARKSAGSGSWMTIAILVVVLILVIVVLK